MSSRDHARGRERHRARRRRTRYRIIVGLALLVAFGVGVALGQALHDNPKPGEHTSIRTIPPLSTGTGP